MKNYKAIDTFLSTWRDASYKYYMGLYEEYRNLYDTVVDVMKKHDIITIPFNKDLLPEEYKVAKQNLEDFKKSIGKGVMNAVGTISYEIHQKRGDTWLNNLLDKEVEKKKVEFIARVEKKSGDIKDVNLKIGVDGSINGTVTGDKTKVDVYSIVAGGWNIQRAHYRVLVNEVRG